MVLSPCHQAAVSKIRMQHGAETKWFHRSCRKAMEEVNGESAGDFTSEYLRYRPDAYRIDRNDRTITVWEVSCKNPVNDAKIRNILNVWRAVDFESWFMVLKEVNRFGDEIVHWDDAALETLNLKYLFLDGGLSVPDIPLMKPDKRGKPWLD